jgi:hypothetical protein
VAALATGRTAAEAAGLGKVGERTVRRRLADPEFCAEVSRARNELVAVATARASGRALEAIDTLTELTALDAPPSVRLGAAKAIIDYGIRLRSESELSERLAVVEAHLGIVSGQRAS